MSENFCALGSLYSSDDLCAEPCIYRTCGTDPEILGRNYPVDTFWSADCGFYWNRNCSLGTEKEKRPAKPDQEGLGRTSKLLENTMTRKLQARMIKAYPNLVKEEKEEVFAAGCGFYKLVSLFFIGAFLGDVTETIFCRFTMGRWMSRSSVVFGPFSIVWGLGCAILTWILYRYREQSDRRLFLCGTILGGAYRVYLQCIYRNSIWHGILGLQ